jgi:oxalate decarboxylase/phosphoglucose isomerase-like protein (cupin superfamily)
MLGGMAMGGVLWSAGASGGETMQPPFGPAPAPLDGPELPSFRYAFASQPTQKFDGGTAKEANVTGFPVSEKLAGVYMTLEPGALRELHWHANAAEWVRHRGTLPRHHHRSAKPVRDRRFRSGRRLVFPARTRPLDPGAGPWHMRVRACVRQRLFLGVRHLLGTMRTVSEREFPISTTMTGALLTIEAGAMRELHWHPNAAEWQLYLKGSARMTVFGSHGRARTDEFTAGDVGYVPQGYGHYIENTGTDELQVVLVLNNATYESISITGRLAANPDLLLATNFGVPESVFAEMSKRAVIMPERG